MDDERKNTFITVLYIETKLVTKSRYLVMNTTPKRIWLFPDSPTGRRAWDFTLGMEIKESHVESHCSISNLVVANNLCQSWVS